jgi:hypothetical protein
MATDVQIVTLVMFFLGVACMFGFIVVSFLGLALSRPLKRQP